VFRFLSKVKLQKNKVISSYKGRY